MQGAVDVAPHRQRLAVLLDHSGAAGRNVIELRHLRLRFAAAMKVVRAGTVGRVDGSPAYFVVDDPLRDQEASRRAVGESPGIESRGDVEPFGLSCRLPDEGHARGGIVVLVASSPDGGEIGRAYCRVRVCPYV